ncbi:MAG: RND transporter [Acidimicrobiia bacterium]
MAAVAVMLGAVPVAVGILRLEVDTSIGSLLPAGDPAVRTWEDTQASFGADPVVLLFEGAPDGLLDPEAVRRLVALEGRLAGLPDVAVVYGPGTTLNQIAIGLNELLVSITARRDGLRAEAEAAARAGGASEAEARAAGAAAVADYEARYGSLVAAGLPLGLPTLANPTFARSVFLDEAGRARAPLRWIVPDAGHAAVYVRPREGLDQDGTDRLVRAVRAAADEADVGTGVTVTGAPVLVASLAAEVRRELPRLGLVALAVVAGVFLASHRARGRRRFLPLAMGLAATAVVVGGFGLVGVPASIGMLVFLPVMLGVGTDLPIQAAHPAPRRVLVAAAVAGAAAFAALAISPLPFVRHLGLALAAGVLISAAFALPFLPSAPAPSGDPVRLRLPGWPVLGAAVVVAAIGWGLLPSLPVEARPDHLARGLPALADARRVERVLGASGEVAVRVTAADVASPDMLAWFRSAEEALVVRFGDRLRPIVSPGRMFSWLGENPTPAQVDAAFNLLPRYLVGATVRGDRREAVAGYGLRLGDLDDQSRLLDEVRRALPAPPPGARVELTGLPVVASRGYDLLAGGRLPASLAGPLLAGAVLVVLVPRRRHGLLALAGALLAVGWGALALRLTGVGLSPLTVGLGALTAAVGCEFTLFALERRAAGLARPWSGVVAAAATSAAGFGVLALSRLDVLAEFGAVLAGSILLALLAARLLTAPLPGSIPAGDPGVPPASEPEPVEVVP